jgi:hypothetical protein
MNNLNLNYERISEVLRKISKEQLLIYQRRKLKMTDLELISLSLAAEFMSIDSENHLLRNLPKPLLSKIERSVNKIRRRNLFNHIDVIRLKLALFLNDFENYFVADSLPLEVCKLSRSKRSKVCKENISTIPNKGYCASQGSRYYGYKLHAICSVSGVFQSIDLSPASVHDINYLKDIKHQISDCTLIGDRDYLSAEIQLNLFETCNIKMNTPMRNNQNNYKKLPYIFRKKRKRIETLFSQLCDQFMIRRNYAKSFDGFKTRILSKITSLTTIQYINKFIFNRNINNIKISII